MEGTMDASNMIKPALDGRGKIRAIGADDAQRIPKIHSKKTRLWTKIQPVYVNEPSVEDTIAILRGLKKNTKSSRSPGDGRSHHRRRLDCLAAILRIAICRTRRWISCDEAASALRMEIDSLPREIDDLDRQKRRSEIEKEV